MTTYQYPVIPFTLKECNLHVSFGSHLLHLLKKLIIYSSFSLVDLSSVFVCWFLIYL